MMKNIAKELNNCGIIRYSKWFVSNARLLHSNSALLQQSKKMEPAEDVLFQDVGDKGVIVLNRPKALNALNLSMVSKMYPILNNWETSKSLVITEGAGDKAYCAGGDVKSLTLALDKPDGAQLGQQFFRTEYSADYLIGTYKKPYVALINGITMGGGVGLSVHGKYRVATEKTLFAMPETAIGLYPDVGGSYFLSRLNNNLGLFLGLTGHRLKGTDVFFAGIATHYVPSNKLTDLKKELLTTENPQVDQILSKHHQIPKDQKFSLEPHIREIENHFSAPSVEEIIKRLKSNNSEWAQQVVQTLSKMSPTSLKITHRAITRGRNLTLSQCFKIDFRLSCRALDKNSDFVEGVRALLVDKDNQPKWNPKTLEEVKEDYIDQLFAPLTNVQELELDDQRQSHL